MKENSVIIIGAGIAGSSLSYFLGKKQWDICLIDKEKPGNLNIYGNPAVAVYPSFMINNLSYNRLMSLSIKHTWNLLNSLDLESEECQMCGAIDLYDTEEGKKRNSLIHKRSPETNELYRLYNAKKIENLYGIKKKIGFYYELGGWVSPLAVCEKLTRKKNIKKFFGTKVLKINKLYNGWEVLTNNQKFHAKNIVLSSAINIKKFEASKHLSVDASRGQVNWVKHNNKSNTLLALNGYHIPNVGSKSIIGSTYSLNNTNKSISSIDFKKNIKTFTSLSSSSERNHISPNDGWVGFRACSYDRNPYVGKLLDQNRLPLDESVNIDDLSWVDGLYVNTCYNSRGFSFAPYASSCLSELMNDNLTDNGRMTLNYLNPERRFLKSIGLRKKLATKF